MPQTGGIYDVGIYATGEPPVPSRDAAGYSLGLRVGNGLLNLSSAGLAGAPRTDPNTILIRQMEVTIRDTAGNAVQVSGPNPYTVPAGGEAIPSGDGMALMEGIAYGEVIPAAYSQDLLNLVPAVGTEAAVVVSVRVVGLTVGNASVTSHAFNFPLTLCNECLRSCPVDESGPICVAACVGGQDTIFCPTEPESCRLNR